MSLLLPKEKYNDESGDNGFAVEDIIIANGSHVTKQQSLFVSNVCVWYDWRETPTPLIPHSNYTCIKNATSN